ARSCAPRAARPRTSTESPHRESPCRPSSCVASVQVECPKLRCSRAARRAAAGAGSEHRAATTRSSRLGPLGRRRVAPLLTLLRNRGEESKRRATRAARFRHDRRVVKSASVLSTLSLALALAVACGPVPGGKLGGTERAVPPDWAASLPGGVQICEV